MFLTRELKRIQKRSQIVGRRTHHGNIIRISFDVKHGEFKIACVWLVANICQNLIYIQTDQKGRRNSALADTMSGFPTTRHSSIINDRNTRFRKIYTQINELWSLECLCLSFFLQKKLMVNAFKSLTHVNEARIYFILISHVFTYVVPLSVREMLTK